jgi:hypothetical protein
MYNKALTDKIVNELEEKGTALQDAIQYEIKLRERSFVNDDRDDIPEGFFKEMQIEEFIEFVADNKEQINISTWEDLKDLLHMELVVNKPYVSNVNSSVEDMLEELEVLIEKMAKTEDFNGCIFGSNKSAK